MKLKALREEVVEANLELTRRGLVLYTFGNASGFSSDDGLMAIKPSGVAFEKLRPDNIVVMDLDGRIVEGELRPSSDAPTHLELYRRFEGIGGVVHTHSTHAVAWAQAGLEIPCLGTTHADYFRGAIPVTDELSSEEIEGEYEAETGVVIARRFAGVDPREIPAVLVRGHGPFCWGPTATDAARNAVLLEEIARMAALSRALNPQAEPISDALRDKHFCRKHGPAAYYGQSGS